MTSTSTRFAIFSSLSLLALCGAVSLGCSDGDSGAATDAGTTPDADGGGGGGGDAGTCAASGTGTVAIVVTGLPDGVAAKVKVMPPAGAATDATGSTTLADAAAGSYEVTAERVARPDAIVRTLYAPTVSSSSFCLEDASTETITVTYAEVPTSNKLWSTTSNSAAQVVAFASTELGATGAPAATITMKGASGGGAGKSVAFDKEGNLWALGPTTVDAPIGRFPAADLGTSGDKTPDRKIAPDFGGCLPETGTIAFDPSGALWVTSPCLEKVLRISPETLGASNKYTPAAEDFASVPAPQGIAFDPAGNMWVSGSVSLRYFPAASLAAGQPHVSTFELTPKAENTAGLPPDALAFDKDGNLWVTNFGGNVIYKLTPADLALSGASKDVVPSVQISISVGAIIESIAFDESGGLWLTYSQGKIARLAPEQLTVSTSPGAPTIPQTIVTSADVNYAGGMAFFPAPAALPIYSRFE
jgi:streptogramin lyase